MISDPSRDALVPLPRLRTISQFWCCAAVLALAGAAALAVDVPLAEWVRAGRAPDLFEKLGGLSEIFGHGLGIVMIVVVIAVLDPARRYAIPRIMAASLGAGLAANIFKLLLARWRPNHVDFNLTEWGLDTFAGWFPLAGNISGQQSFPSSHMATAVGLAIVLTAFYPRGRWLFPTCAALAGMQRLLHQSHFLSDICWGAAVGCLFAPLCIYGSRLSMTFDRLEAYLLQRPVSDPRTDGPTRRRTIAKPAPTMGSNAR